MAKASSRSNNAIFHNRMTHNVTLKTYVIGFGGALALTVLSFLLVAKHVESEYLWLSHSAIVSTLLGLAALQFIVQLICFLHLGLEAKQRFNLAILVATVSVVLVIVVGSIWIMNHLNYNMTPQETDLYMREEG